jgi:hypothetical protein
MTKDKPRLIFNLLRRGATRLCKRCSRDLEQRRRLRLSKSSEVSTLRVCCLVCPGVGCAKRSSRLRYCLGVRGLGSRKRSLERVGRWSAAAAAVVVAITVAILGLQIWTTWTFLFSAPDAFFVGPLPIKWVALRCWKVSGANWNIPSP